MFLGKTLYSHSASLPPGVQIGTGEFYAPIQGGVEILLVASCYRNRDKLRPDGPLGSYADYRFLHNIHVLVSLFFF